MRKLAEDVPSSLQQLIKRSEISIMYILHLNVNPTIPEGIVIIILKKTWVLP